MLCALDLASNLTWKPQPQVSSMQWHARAEQVRCAMTAQPGSQQHLDLCTRQAASHHGEGSRLQDFRLGVASMGKIGLTEGLNHTQCLNRKAWYVVQGFFVSLWHLRTWAHAAQVLHIAKRLSWSAHFLLVMRSCWTGLFRSFCLSCCRRERLGQYGTNRKPDA